MKSILTVEETAGLCEKCGRCCQAPVFLNGKRCYIGGTQDTDRWLRRGGECRFLLPANHAGFRLCAIRNVTVIDGRDKNGMGINARPLRPELCRLAPTRSQLENNVLPDCPVTRAAKEKLK